MKTQYELLKEKIEETLDFYRDREDDDRDVQEKASQECGMGFDILRWSRQGILKIDEKALAEKFGVELKQEIIRHGS